MPGGEPEKVAVVHYIGETLNKDCDVMVGEENSCVPESRLL